MYLSIKGRKTNHTAKNIYNSALKFPASFSNPPPPLKFFLSRHMILLAFHWHFINISLTFYLKLNILNYSSLSVLSCMFVHIEFHQHFISIHSDFIGISLTFRKHFISVSLSILLKTEHFQLLFFVCLVMHVCPRTDYKVFSYHNIFAQFYAIVDHQGCNEVYRCFIQNLYRRSLNNAFS